MDHNNNFQISFTDHLNQTHGTQPQESHDNEFSSFLHLLSLDSFFHSMNANSLISPVESPLVHSNKALKPYPPILPQLIHPPTINPQLNLNSLGLSQIAPPPAPSPTHSQPSPKEKKRRSKAKSSYSCTFPNCTRVFPRLYNLKSHLLVHTGEKPHACTYCGTSFGRKHDLQRHIRTLHTGHKEKCDCCGKKFGRVEQLRKHTCLGYAPLTNCEYPEYGNTMQQQQQQQIVDLPLVSMPINTCVQSGTGICDLPTVPTTTTATMTMTSADTSITTIQATNTITGNTPTIITESIPNTRYTEPLFIPKDQFPLVPSHSPLRFEAHIPVIGDGLAAGATYMGLSTGNCLPPLRYDHVDAFGQKSSY